jgi:hypothetical protein
LGELHAEWQVVRNIKYATIMSCKEAHEPPDGVERLSRAPNGIQALAESGEPSISGFWRRGWSEILSSGRVTANLKTPSFRSIGTIKTAALGDISPLVIFQP